MHPDREASFARSSLLTFAALVLSAILGVAWITILGRTLEPQEVGTVAVIILYSTLLYTIGNLTFGLSTVYHIGQKKYPIADFATNSLLVGTATGVLLCLLFTATVLIAGDVLCKGIGTKYLYLVPIAAVLQLVVYHQSAVLQGIGHIRDYNLVNIVRSLLAVLLLVFLVVFIGWRVLGAVAAFAASFVAAAVLAFYYGLKQTGSQWHVNLSLLGSTLASGCKLHIATVATFVYGQAGILVVNHYLSSSEVGYLYVAMVYAQFLFLIPQAVQVVLHPMAANASEEDTVDVCARVCRHTLLWMLVGVALFGILSEFILQALLGETFYPSLLLARILLPGILLSSVTQVMSALWIRRGWYWFMAGSGVAVGAAGVAAQLLLVTRYGAVGSAIASDLTYLTGFVIVLCVYFLRVDRRAWWLFIPQPRDFEFYRSLLTRARGIVSA